MNGEGSIYQRQSDSRWFGSIVEAGEDGKLKRKTVSAKTKDAARIKLKRLMGEQERLQAEGLPPMDTTVTVSQLLDRWHKVIVATRRETLLGPDGVILYQSASGRSVLGYKVGDLLGKTFVPLDPPRRRRVFPGSVHQSPAWWAGGQRRIRMPASSYRRQLDDYQRPTFTI